METQSILLLILFIILQIPVFYGAIYAHELSHKYDFRNIEKTNEDFCVGFNCNEGSFGHYKFESKITPEVLEIHKYTEFKAWSITIGVLLAYILFVLMCLKYILL